MRLLLFVVAYKAQGTLKKVLDRIPSDFVAANHTEALIIDDASPDQTFEAGLSWADDWSESPITVLRNPRSQGYGGNLKLGFEFAIQHQFDAVVLLHADGKYAPESLPELVGPIARGEVDAVVGSRFMETGSARAGGMPWLRGAANRALTRVQSALLGEPYSDFHSGYRAYAVDALSAIPFRYNSDDLHFDTEILIQLKRAAFRVAQVPIPTYYGDEIAYPRGVRYAIESLGASLAAVLDSVGIHYRRKFDVRGGPPAYAPKFGYRSSHTMAVDAVAPGSRVLDVGCGQGYVARELLAKDCHVVGLDQLAPDPANVSEFVHWRIGRDDIPVRLADYDAMLILDVLEHLPDPERFLEKLRAAAELVQPTIVLTAPNVAFLPLRAMLMLGQFNYGKEGILDFTHTRLFTFRSLRDLLEQRGYEILEERGIPAPYPKALGDNAFARALVAINDALIRVSKSTFAYQVFLKIRPLPTVDLLLADTIRHSHERRDALAGKTPETDPQDEPENGA